MRYFFLVMVILHLNFFSTFCFAELNDDDQRNVLTVKLTDGPANYAALYVEILHVEIFGEEQGWITVCDQSQFINVLSLTNGTEIELAQISALPDVYTKMMIRFGQENMLYLYGDKTADGGIATIAKTLGWQGSHDLYIPIYQEIPGKANEILLDFNVAESIIKEDENFLLQPAVYLLENKSTGISGHVGGKSMVLIELKNKNNFYSTFADMDGNFLIRGVEPGIYEITITPNFVGYESHTDSGRITYRIQVVDGSIQTMDAIFF